MTEEKIEGSTPSVFEFAPVIPYQKTLLKKIRFECDYSLGAHEFLLSGSLGSAKSTIAAHAAVTHCLFNNKARILIGRRSLPDAKRTIYQKIVEHLDGALTEGRDYWLNTNRGQITFRNGSEIISGSWADKRYMKFRSIDLSAAIFEEIVENEGDDIQAYKEIKARVGRLPHIKENWIISNTNPGSPASYWHKYFIEKPSPTRHVIYSRTDENPFLPPQYIEQLKADMDPKEARRMIYGEWIDLDEDVIYYNYKKERNYLDACYLPSPAHPVDVSFDFNIADGKPMSACLSQLIDGCFHFFKSYAVFGARTSDLLDEISPILEKHRRFRIFGDASGKSRDTRSIKSDYDIIKEFFANHHTRPEFEMLVPLSNPPIRERHNLMNAQFLDANGNTKCFVYNEASTLDEGFRLTKLKKGGNYIEDDTFHAQHVTTAAGYCVHYLLKRHREKRQAYRLM